MQIEYPGTPTARTIFPRCAEIFNHLGSLVNRTGQRRLPVSEQRVQAAKLQVYQHPKILSRDLQDVKVTYSTRKTFLKIWFTWFRIKNKRTSASTTIFVSTSFFFSELHRQNVDQFQFFTLARSCWWICPSRLTILRILKTLLSGALKSIGRFKNMNSTGEKSSTGEK